MKIGMFDSGLGGLTVLDAVRRKIPSLSIDYFGDTARVPYGNKSGETIIRYSKEIAAFLLRREISMLVVACNSASAYALTTLQKELPIPVIGVIQPSAELAAKTTKSGKIGVLATKATVRSHAYREALHAIDPRFEVTEVACPLLVPLIEEGALTHPAAELILASYLEEVRDCDTLLLGCTHYPLLLPLLKRVSQNSVSLIDSASAVATLIEQCVPVLDREGTLSFFVSDDPKGFIRHGSTFIDYAITAAEQVEEFSQLELHQQH